MTTPDVRIRLSAEGVAEVVSALKKVQAEGQKTGAAGSRSFLGLNSVLGSTANLLDTMGVAVGVGSFIGFIKNASEAADQVGKLSQKVGASVENLSALNLAAATADVGTEQLTVGLVKLNKKIAELAEGSPEAATSFKRLDDSLSAKDFKGKDAVQAFDLISQRLAKVGDGAKKTKIAVDLFGKSGAQLIPVMNDLAEEGLGNLIERARELGVLLSDDMVASTQKMNDDFKLLKLQAQGLGIQFATGLAPSVSQSLSIMSGGLAQSKDAWKDFGQGVGVVVKFIVAMVADAFDILAVRLAQVAIDLVSTGRAMSAVIKGDFKRALAEMKAGGDASEAEMAALWARIAGRDRLATTAAEPAKPRTGVPGEDEDPAALAQRQAAAARTFYLVDKPGAAQSVIRIGNIGVPRSTADFFPLQVMNTILGGSFTSRLNQNLRETHGYTYGANSSFAMRRMAGPFQAGASVQSAKTDSALIEFLRELRRIRDEAVPQAELDKAKAYIALSLPGDFETTAGSAGQFSSLLTFGLPLDYYNSYVARINAVTAADVQRVARQYLDLDRFTIVVVGDRSQIEAGIRALNEGPISIRDLWGQEIR
jgi:hypothetical protein